MEGDRAISGDSWKRPAFQSTPSAWRETPEYCKRNQGKRYFNPLPPHGGRPVTEIVRLAMEIFQSTPSAWRETRKRRRCGHCGIFQSTPSAWRETIDLVDGDPAIIISIHSLRMEGDLFQATPMPEPLNFNPLPPHGGRRYACAGVSAGLYISIHSLRMEGDVSFASQISTWKYFNPLPPHGGRRGNLFLLSGIRRISIHSLRMEGDLGNTPKPQRITHFNPLPPHGGRPGYGVSESIRYNISIHSLRMEGDMRPCASCRFPNKAVHAIET